VFGVVDLVGEVVTKSQGEKQSLRAVEVRASQIESRSMSAQLLGR
jgi:hypothetical protein